MNRPTDIAAVRAQAAPVAAPSSAPRGRFERILFDAVGVRFPLADGHAHEAIVAASFAAERGRITCIIGPSGSGKTTLLNAVAGFVAPTSGAIAVEGGGQGLAQLRKAYVFQDYALFPWRTARRNVEFGLQVLGCPRKERRERALAALRQVGLEAFADFYPHRLSGGMKQRVAVARALAFDPDVLLMDEPFSALDEETREGLQDLVVRLWQESRRTILYVTHSIAEAVFLADRVVALSGGPGTVRATVDIDLAKPRDRYAEAFVQYEQQLAGLVRKQEGGR